MPMQEMAPPPTEMVLPKSGFEGPVPAAVDSTDPRQLKRRLSDPASRKRLRGPDLGGVTGQLLQFRETGLRDGRALHDRFGKLSNNMAKRAKLAFSRIGSSMSAGQLATVDAYQSALERAKKVTAGVKTWTLAEAPDQLKELKLADDILKKLAD